MKRIFLAVFIIIIVFVVALPKALAYEKGIFDIERLEKTISPLFEPKNQKGEVKAENVNVSAIVPSDVSKSKSQIVLNAKETLVDPENHSILLSIYLYDNSSNPLSDLWVEISSNRGGVDIIEEVLCTEFEENSGSAKCKTDANGQASFKISSYTPGEVTLSITADTIVEFDAVKIKFLPLPFPTNLTLVLHIPWLDKELTLLAPPAEAEEMSKAQIEAQKLANTGTKINIPFWPAVTVLGFIVLSPIFLFWNFWNLSRLRKLEKREVELLKKIAAHDGMENLRKEVGGRR